MRQPRFAVVVTVATRNGSLGGGNFLMTAQGWRCLLNGTISSLRSAGWSGDVLCQTAGFDAEAEREFGAMCTVISLPVPYWDAGPDYPDVENSTVFQRWMRKKGRVPPPDESTVQVKRRDGALTAVKLHTWTQIDYDMILHTDLDVRFFESPLPALELAHAQKLVFQAAHAETGSRIAYRGFNSHMLLLKPSLELHALLSANAAQGHFIPYTRGEQDVLESLFPQSVGLASSDEAVDPRRWYSTPADGTRSTPKVSMPLHSHFHFHGCLLQPQRKCGAGSPVHQISSIIMRDPGGHSADGGALRVRWLSGAEYSAQGEGSIPFSALCGAALELAISCDERLWRVRMGMLSTRPWAKWEEQHAKAASSMDRTARLQKRFELAAAEIEKHTRGSEPSGSQRYGCFFPVSHMDAAAVSFVRSGAPLLPKRLGGGHPADFSARERFAAVDEGIDP